MMKKKIDGLVRFFVHKLDEDSYNELSFADGDIDLQVIQKKI